MQKQIEYPISPNYCKNWTVKEAIREVIANAMDTKTKYKVSWKNGRGYVSDEGPGIAREYFVLGEGENKNQEQIGQFKEGLKIAALVFARENRDVAGSTKSYGFKFTIKKSEDFGCDVLHLEFNESVNSTGTLVSFNCSEEELRDTLAKFLPVQVSAESVVLPNEPGKLYIQGVYVQNIDAIFGYNITAKEAANRDRSVLDMNLVKQQIASILSKTTNKMVIRKLLEQSSKNGIEYGTRFEPSNTKKWLNMAHQIYGKRICLSDDWNQEKNHFAADKGYRIITPVSWEMRQVMAYIGIERADSVLKKKQSMGMKKARKQLTTEQKEALSKAKKITQQVIGTKIKVSVVEKVKNTGVNQDVLAYYDRGQNRVFITVQAIDQKFSDLVGTLIHEGVHQISGASDLTREFENALTSKLGELATKGLKKG